jgi:hypothetical protein
MLFPLPGGRCLARALAAALLVPLIGAGCKKSNGGGDGGVGVPDICNTQNDGTTDPQCELKLVTSACGDGGSATCGTASGAYVVNKKGKQLWLKVLLPQTLSPINLFRVTAQYALPSTPVNLDVNLLDLLPTGPTSLAHQFESHGSGAPKPVTITIQTPSPTYDNHEFLILIVDHTGLNLDVHPFSVRVDLLLDLDPNNPNIVNPIPLSATSVPGVVAGSASGYLSTAGRADRFSVDVPNAGNGREILYLRLTAKLGSGPALYLLSYLITPDPLSPKQLPNPVGGGQVGNAYTDPNLATALLVSAQKYDITVLQTPTLPGGPTPGDPTMQFSLTVMAMPDVDANEPNDTLAQGEATTGDVLTFAAPGAAAQSRTGRISYVGDYEWFAVDLMPNANPSRLHYQLVPSGVPGRYPPLPAPSNRWLQVATNVGDGGPSQITACLTDPGSCPRDSRTDDNSNVLLGAPNLLAADCNSSDGVLCPWSSRLEDDQDAPALQNFQGFLPVAPHGAPQRYYIVYRDLDGQYANDVDYTLTLQWLTEVPDKANGLHDTPANATKTTIPADPAAASFPAPPPSNPDVATGIISTGYGYNVVDQGGGQFLPVPFAGGVRRANDYDALPSSNDVYEIDFPGGFVPSDFVDGGQYVSGSTWELQWSVDNGTSGAPPYQLGVEVVFCSLGDAGPGTCVPVPDPIPPVFGGTPAGANSTLAYRTDQLATWYNFAFGYTQYQQSVWDDSPPGLRDTVTARAYGCFCFEPGWMQAGRFYATVVARNRIAYEDQPYHLRMAFTSYPKTFTDPDAGVVKCPVEVTDGVNTYLGCKFSLQIVGRGLPDAG